MFRWILAAAAFAGPATAASAQSYGPAAPPRPAPSRDDCDNERESLDEEEIVVCAQYEDGEAYRVPRELRERLPVPDNQSWSSRAAANDQLLRNEDQVSGAGAASGYTRDQAARYRDERAERRRRQREVEQALDPEG